MSLPKNGGTLVQRTNWMGPCNEQKLYNVKIQYNYSNTELYKMQHKKIMLANMFMGSFD